MSLGGPQTPAHDEDEDENNDDDDHALCHCSLGFYVDHIFHNPDEKYSNVTTFHCYSDDDGADDADADADAESPFHCSSDTCCGFQPLLVTSPTTPTHDDDHDL